MDAAKEMALYDLDTTIFNLMEIYNIPSSGYTDATDLYNQMNKLHRIIDANPDYFGTLNTGYNDSQFLTDYKLYKAGEIGRLKIFLSEGNYHNYGSWYAAANNVGWDDPDYVSRNNAYEQRLGNLNQWYQTY